jgi:hypothetical protein
LYRASSTAGFGRAYHCCRKWMRSIRSSPKTCRPPVTGSVPSDSAARSPHTMPLMAPTDPCPPGTHRAASGLQCFSGVLLHRQAHLLGCYRVRSGYRSQLRSRDKIRVSLKPRFCQGILTS